jgi:hypothetical protein
VSPCVEQRDQRNQDEVPAGHGQETLHGLDALILRDPELLEYSTGTILRLPAAALKRS